MNAPPPPVLFLSQPPFTHTHTHTHSLNNVATISRCTKEERTGARRRPVADPGAAFICVGSYDNTMRAVQTSIKGVYRKHGGSSAFGFRCVRDSDSHIDSEPGGTEEATA